MSIPSILNFAKKKFSDDVDIPTAAIKANAYLKIVNDCLYNELIQKSESLLGSLSSVSTLENEYSEVAKKLEDITFVTKQR